MHEKLVLFAVVNLATGCALETTQRDVETRSAAATLDQRCAYLAEWHVESADFVEDANGGTCRILRCADGWANATDADELGRTCIPLAKQAEDGCEISLWHQASYAEPYIELPTLRGEAGRDARGTSYYGYGTTDFLILLTEDEDPSAIHDMNVKVRLAHHPAANYHLEAWGPGECWDPTGQWGFREGGFTTEGCSGGSVFKNVDLTWPDREGINDWAYVWIRVSYLGGSALGAGYFALFVGSTDYEESIDYVSRDRWDNTAHPSLACQLP